MARYANIIQQFNGVPVAIITSLEDRDYIAERTKKKKVFAFANSKLGFIGVFPEFLMLPKQVQDVILWHEYAHIKGIQDEAEADKYAASKCGQEALDHARNLTKDISDIKNIISKFHTPFKLCPAQ